MTPDEPACEHPRCGDYCYRAALEDRYDQQAMNATIPRVPRQRGFLTAPQERRLERAAEKRDAAETAYRAEVLAVMAEGASFSEVSKATGLSTNTLQRWKREAGQ